jgi:hypothetical protein
MQRRPPHTGPSRTWGICRARAPGGGAGEVGRGEGQGSGPAAASAGGRVPTRAIGWWKKRGWRGICRLLRLPARSQARPGERRVCLNTQQPLLPGCSNACPYHRTHLHRRRHARPVCCVRVCVRAARRPPPCPRRRPTFHRRCTLPLAGSTTTRAALSLSSITKRPPGPHATRPCALRPTLLTVAATAGRFLDRSILMALLCARSRAHGMHARRHVPVAATRGIGKAACPPRRLPQGCEPRQMHLCKSIALLVSLPCTAN